MKRIIYILTTLVFMINTGCVHPQSKDEQIISMLEEFYTAHCELWSIEPIPPPNELFIKLDSLYEKYCSKELRNESKEWFFYGHDLLTNDWGMQKKDIKTIEIKKDSSINNMYIVNYTTFLDNPGKISQKKEVSLRLLVVEKDDNYKIDMIME